MISNLRFFETKRIILEVSMAIRTKIFDCEMPVYLASWCSEVPSAILPAEVLEVEIYDTASHRIPSKGAWQEMSISPLVHLLSDLNRSAGSLTQGMFAHPRAHQRWSFSWWCCFDLLALLLHDHDDKSCVIRMWISDLQGHDWCC